MKLIIFFALLTIGCNSKEQAVDTGCVTALRVSDGKRVLLYCGKWDSTADFYFRQPMEHSNIWLAGSSAWEQHTTCQTCAKKYGN